MFFSVLRYIYIECVNRLTYIMSGKFICKFNQLSGHKQIIWII